MEKAAITSSGKSSMKSISPPSALTRRLTSVALGFSIGLTAMLMLSACEVDSANATARSVGADVSGVYRHDGSSENGGRFVSANSGAQVTSLDLRQAGDQLEAIDNNGIIFRGTIGTVVDSSASFNLEGSTTIGSGVIISGTIDIGGGEGVMRATWIEDTLFATVYGVANGPTINTNTPAPTNGVTNAFFRAYKPMIQNELADYKQTALWFLEG